MNLTVVYLKISLESYLPMKFPVNLQKYLLQYTIKNKNYNKKIMQRCKCNKNKKNVRKGKVTDSASSCKHNSTERVSRFSLHGSIMALVIVVVLYYCLILCCFSFYHSLLLLFILNILFFRIININLSF